MINYTHYCGVDPGFEGGFGVVNAARTTAKCWPMPVIFKNGKDSKREFDMPGLKDLFQYVKRYPSVLVTIEWPTTRPGEGAERSERFGRGKGYLHAYAFLLGLDFKLVAPSAWKGRMGLPGKTDDPGSKQGFARWCQDYPAHRDLVLGPRGGILDGLLDSLLIAEYGRLGETSSVGWKGGKRPPTFRGLPNGLESLPE